MQSAASAAVSPALHSPSAQVLSNLVTELMAHPPFAQMAPACVARLLAAASQAYYEPEEVLLQPSDGPVTQLLYLRRGKVSGRHGLADAHGGFEYEAGDLFPIGALMGERAVTANYTASADAFCLLFPASVVKQVARDSAAWADFLNRRVQQFLTLSRKALQVAYASASLAEQSLETPLSALLKRSPFTVPPQTPLAQALQAMHDKRIGSVLITGDEGQALGILTRHDILGRVTLPGLPLTTPVQAVMSQPVQCLHKQQTAQDAALLMSRHGIRHVPVTDDGQRVVGILSERDLFALQRLSLKQVSSAIRAAGDVDTLRAVAADIRRFARNLLGQGVQARQLTELISHLNDVLGERLVQLLAAEHGIDLGRVCWLAFGSEGRSEQTIATDQDNGIAFDSDTPDADRPKLLRFAQAVNEALDACGYPLCKGNVMARNPEVCLSVKEWMGRFGQWLDGGRPEDLLNASIYFDFRPLAGATVLTRPMREWLAKVAPQQARFMKLMAENALRLNPALNWLGGIDTQSVGGQEVIDLKLRGTAVFVDAARLYALAHGVTATSTRERLQAAAQVFGVAANEAEAWVSAFEFLQMLRLQVQLDRERRSAVDAPDGNPNLVDVAALNEIDRRVLKESLRVARRLQQRIEMDYRR
jgi:CBS domain-containing protein